MIRTLADGTVSSGGRTHFVIESLYTGEDFNIKDALVVPQYSNDEGFLFYFFISSHLIAA